MFFFNIYNIHILHVSLKKNIYDIHILHVFQKNNSFWYISRNEFF